MVRDKGTGTMFGLAIQIKIVQQMRQYFFLTFLS